MLNDPYPFCPSVAPVQVQQVDDLSTFAQKRATSSAEYSKTFGFASGNGTCIIRRCEFPNELRGMARPNDQRLIQFGRFRPPHQPPHRNTRHKVQGFRIRS